MGYLKKLLDNSSPSINKYMPSLTKEIISMSGKLSYDLLEMLRLRNGFYSLEGALHVFPAQATEQEYGINEWNSDKLWRKSYDRLEDGLLFFAEDIFGGQFCIYSDRIYQFDPETADLEHMADGLEEWAGKITQDYDYYTGYSLAHEWQKKNGPIPINNRLVPKLPFIMGGEFSLGNLYLTESVAGMRARANIANQIRNLPDGKKICLEITD